jgi:pimeloyl-ACP methyl ester carboxylesterase
VIFIHGLIGPFRVPATLSLCPDLLGYGVEARADPTEITIDAQVEYVRAVIDGAMPAGRVHVVGHSAGGVIAAVYAHRYPERVASFVNVEGNFTLADAFWSAQLASKSPAEIEGILRAEAAISHALDYQPATTVRAMAQAVIDFTGDPGYEPMLREVFARTPVHLVAGARSRAGWDVPDWALNGAASYTEVPDAGHMVMDDAPEAFGELLARLLD